MTPTQQTVSPEVAQLKQQLNGIIAPPAQFELAPGWWILITITLCILATVVVWMVITYRANAYRRAALARLDQLAKQEPIAPDELNALLKQVAIHVYGRSDVASLVGADWVDFLSKNKGSAEFSDSLKYYLAEGMYKQSEAQPQREFIQFARQWLRSHKKPKLMRGPRYV